MTRYRLSPLLQEGHPYQTSDDNYLAMEAGPLSGRSRSTSQQHLVATDSEIPSLSLFRQYSLYGISANDKYLRWHWIWHLATGSSLLSVGWVTHQIELWLFLTTHTSFVSTLLPDSHGEGLRSFLWSTREQRGICLFRLDCTTWFKGRCARFSQ